MTCHVDGRDNFLQNASECREAMETLLKEAYAYRRVTARTESERNQRNNRFANGSDMYINAVAIHAVGSVYVQWPHVGTMAYSQAWAFTGELALIRNSAQARTSNTLRSDLHRVTSTTSPRKTVLQRLGSTSEDLTDSEVAVTINGIGQRKCFSMLRCYDIGRLTMCASFKHTRMYF